MKIRLPDQLTPVRIVIGLVVALALVATIWWFLTEPGRQRDRANRATAGRVVAEGQAKAAQDAVGVITGQGGRESATDKLTQENRDAILNSPGADVPINPDLDARARRALCLRDAYRDQPACVRLLGSDPR